MGVPAVFVRMSIGITVLSYPPVTYAVSPSGVIAMFPEGPTGIGVPRAPDGRLTGVTDSLPTTYIAEPSGVTAIAPAQGRSIEAPTEFVEAVIGTTDPSFADTYTVRPLGVIAIAFAPPGTAISAATRRVA